MCLLQQGFLCPHGVDGKNLPARDQAVALGVAVRSPSGHAFQVDQREWDYGARLPRDSRAPESWSTAVSPESPDIQPSWGSRRPTPAAWSRARRRWPGRERADAWAQQAEPEGEQGGQVERTRWSEVADRTARVPGRRRRLAHRDRRVARDRADRALAADHGVALRRPARTAGVRPPRPGRRAPARRASVRRWTRRPASSWPSRARPGPRRRVTSSRSRAPPRGSSRRTARRTAPRRGSVSPSRRRRPPSPARRGSSSPLRRRPGSKPARPAHRRGSRARARPAAERRGPVGAGCSGSAAPWQQSAPRQRRAVAGRTPRRAPPPGRRQSRRRRAVAARPAAPADPRPWEQDARLGVLAAAGRADATDVGSRHRPRPADERGRPTGRTLRNRETTPDLAVAGGRFRRRSSLAQRIRGAQRTARRYGGAGPTAYGASPYAETRSVPFDDGRHLVREDDRAQWRREAQERRSTPRRTPPRGRARIKNIRRYGLEHAFRLGQLGRARGHRQHGDPRRPGRHQRPELGKSLRGPELARRSRRAVRRLADPQRQLARRARLGQLEPRRGARPGAAAPTTGSRSAGGPRQTTGTTPAARPGGGRSAGSRPRTTAPTPRRPDRPQIGWQPARRDAAPAATPRRPSGRSAGSRPRTSDDDDPPGRRPGGRRAAEPETPSWQRSAPAAIGWRPAADERDDTDGPSWRQDPRWQDERDAPGWQETGSVTGARRRDAEPADPWAQSAADTGIIPLTGQQPTTDTGSWRSGTGAVGRARPMNPNRRRDEIGETSSRLGARAAAGRDRHPDRAAARRSPTRTYARRARRRSARRSGGASPAPARTAPTGPRKTRRTTGAAISSRRRRGRLAAGSGAGQRGAGGRVGHRDPPARARRVAARGAGGGRAGQRELPGREHRRLAPRDGRRDQHEPGRRRVAPVRHPGFRAVPAGRLRVRPAPASAPPTARPVRPARGKSCWSAVASEPRAGRRGHAVAAAAVDRLSERQTGSYERRPVGGGLDPAPSRQNNLLDPDEDEMRRTPAGRSPRSATR